MTAAGIGAGPGEKFASGSDGLKGRIEPFRAGCGSMPTPSSLSGGEGVSTHTVETVSSSESARPFGSLGTGLLCSSNASVGAASMNPVNPPPPHLPPTSPGAMDAIAF
jgi:hypothetical protein